MKAGILLLACSPALAQLQFDAATVKISKGDTKVAAGYSKSGQFVAPNATLKDLVILAYGLHESQILGAPSWFDSDRFDIFAKAAPETKFDDVRIMIQSLLRERFGLAVHIEERTLPAYSLTLAKGGSKLEASAAAQTGCAPGQSVKWGMLHLTCRMVANSTLAGVLLSIGHGYLEHVPVVDDTGLNGTWDFTLDFTPKPEFDAGSADHPVVSFFDALQEQLGLRLDLRKLPLHVLVIDRADRVPSEN